MVLHFNKALEGDSESVLRYSSASRRGREGVVFIAQSQAAADKAGSQVEGRQD